MAKTLEFTLSQLGLHKYFALVVCKLTFTFPIPMHPLLLICIALHSDQTDFLSFLKSKLERGYHPLCDCNFFHQSSLTLITLIVTWIPSTCASLTRYPGSSKPLPQKAMASIQRRSEGFGARGADFRLPPPPRPPTNLKFTKICEIAWIFSTKFGYLKTNCGVPKGQLTMIFYEKQTKIIL